VKGPEGLEKKGGDKCKKKAKSGVVKKGMITNQGQRIESLM